MRMTDEQRAELIRRRMSRFGYWKQETAGDISRIDERDEIGTLPQKKHALFMKL